MAGFSHLELQDKPEGLAQPHLLFMSSKLKKTRSQELFSNVPTGNLYRGLPGLSRSCRSLSMFDNRS